MVAPVPFALDHVLDAVVEACVRELTASERWLAIARAEAMGLEARIEELEQQLSERDAELLEAKSETQKAIRYGRNLMRRIAELEGAEAKKQALTFAGNPTTGRVRSMTVVRAPVGTSTEQVAQAVADAGVGRRIPGTATVEVGREVGPVPVARSPGQRRKPASLTPPALAGTPETLRHPLKPPGFRAAGTQVATSEPVSLKTRPSEPIHEWPSRPHVPDDDDDELNVPAPADDEDQEDDLLARSLELAADDKHGKGWHTAGARLSGGDREERRRKEREDDAEAEEDKESEEADEGDDEE